MKSLLLATVLAFSFSAFANQHRHHDDDCVTGHDKNGHCEDDKYFSCFATDANGATYKVYSAGWLSETSAQARVFSICKKQTQAPGTCKPLGCQDRY